MMLRLNRTLLYGVLAAGLCVHAYGADGAPAPSDEYVTVRAGSGPEKEKGVARRGAESDVAKLLSKGASGIEARAAEVTARVTSDAQIVTLPYQPNATTSIPVRPGMFVTMAFPKGDPIQQFAVANPDAVQLNVNAAANVAMLKLTSPVSTVATVVTSQRIFYLRIVPAPNGPWYQGVSWSVGSDGGAFSSLYSAPTVEQAAAAPASAGASAAPSLYTGEPNFSYRIIGTAPFRPVAVWDNGRFTWVQFPANLQELPALFADGPNGLQVVNYTTHNNGTQILVNRLMRKFVLRLGKEEVQVEADDKGAR